MKKAGSLILCLTLLLSFCATAFADSEISIVRPSVEIKEVDVVPEEVIVVDPEHPEKEPEAKLMAGEIVNILDEEHPFEEESVIRYYDIPEVYITPYAQKDNIPYESLSAERKAVIKTGLEDAYKKILALDTVGTLNAQLEERAKSIDESYNSWIFVASDIFDLSLEELEEEKLAGDEEAYFRLTVRLTNPVKESQNIAVLHRPQSTMVWEVLPENHVRVNDNGTISLLFDTLCPIVILTSQPERMKDYEEYLKHPGCGEEGCKCPSWCPFCKLFCKNGHCNCLMALLILLAIIVALVLVIVRNMDKTAEAKARDDKFNELIREGEKLKEQNKLESEGQSHKASDAPAPKENQVKESVDPRQYLTPSPGKDKEQ